MSTRTRCVAVVLCALLTGCLSVVTGAGTASATVTTLCRGYAACARAGMSASGYAAASGTMWWRMYAGHNCTNYAAYRIVRSGLPNVRPWTGSGNATNWGAAMGGITNSTPAVGAVAWWRAYVSPAGSAGHVAYVERVVSANEIIVSQDSWGGDFSWARITRTSSGWPSGFVHFNDVPLRNTTRPTLTGTPRVGSALAAVPGVWNPGDATLRYQWRANGINIAGATGQALALGLPQQGKRITVRVTASKLGFPTTSVESPATTAVQPGVISNTVAPSVSGEPSVDATLTASAGRWNPVPDRLLYQWRADGVPIDGATSTTMSVRPGLVAKAISVRVTAAKTGYAAVGATSTATAPVRPGTLTVTSPPAVSGLAHPGQTLTLADAGVLPQAVASVQWLRARVPVAGATSGTYRVTTADLGARIAARVRLTRDGYTPVTVRSGATALVRSTPTVRVTTQPGTGRLVVAASVTARGVTPVTGVIRVRSRGTLLKEIPLRDGSARATVTGLPRGTWTFRFRYPTTSTVSGLLVERRIRIG